MFRVEGPQTRTIGRGVFKDRTSVTLGPNVLFTVGGRSLTVPHLLDLFLPHGSSLPLEV